MRKLILFALLLCGFGIDLAHARTWFVRADGGTRYSSNVPTGQCNGQYDAPYPGSGVNQNCAYNDFRYLYDDDSGHSFNTNNASGNYMGTWVINGGDTVVIRGCTALPTQVNPSNPACRIGWDAPTQGGSTSGNLGVNPHLRIIAHLLPCHLGRVAIPRAFSERARMELIPATQ